MTEWRRYTTTPRPQVAWTGLVALSVVVAAVAGVGVLVLAAAVGTWLVGLVVFGVRERRHWRRLSSASSFERQAGTSRADLQRIVRGHAVSVTTDLDGPLEGSHAEVTAPVTDVDASFSVRIATSTLNTTAGDEAFDDRYAVRGMERNAELLLSPDVREALLAVRTPGVVTVSDARVKYEVPFTRLTTEELRSITVAVVTLVERVEQVGQ
jgi:hypothetical protein